MKAPLGASEASKKVHRLLVAREAWAGGTRLGAQEVARVADVVGRGGSAARA